MKLKLLIIIYVLLLNSNTINAQWAKGKGNAYLKLSAWSITSNQHYTDIGKIDPNTTRGQFNLNFYGEYGISNKLDIIAYVPFFSRAYQNDVFSKTTNQLLTKGEAVNAIGDIDLGIRYAIFKKNNWALSTTLKLGLPTGKDNGGSDGSFQTGDGEFNQFLSTELGYSSVIKGLPYYAKTYIGYNNRTNNFSDEFKAGLEFGINLFNNKFWTITRLNNVSSLNNGSLNAQTSQGSIFANNVEYTSYGVEGAYKISKKWGISLGIDSAFRGRIIAASPSINGGIFFDLN